MIQLVFLSSILVVTYGQYPHQVAPGGPPADGYQQRHQPEPAYQPRQQAAPAYQPRQLPVPVHNPASVHYVNIGEQLQGDYKFGYDTGKGNDGQSFREETRLPDGTVQGAYGYVDGSGRQRIVKYTAGKDGFKAEGDVGPEGVPQAASPGPAPRPVHRPPAPAPAYNQQQYSEPPQQRPPQQYSAPQQYNSPQPQSYAPRPAPQSYAPRPAPQSYAPRPEPQYHAPRPAPQSYAPRPAPQSYAPRPAPQSYASRPAPQSYDDPSNDLSETAVDVPIDTTLFNYNIGIKQ